jgi:hypothetical protein
LIAAERKRIAVIVHFIVDSVRPREEPQGEEGSPTRLSKFDSERVRKDDKDNCAEEDAECYMKYTKCTCDWSEVAGEKGATTCQSHKEADTEPGIEVDGWALDVYGAVCGDE